jgi:hypothetical protein
VDLLVPVDLLDQAVLQVWLVLVLIGKEIGVVAQIIQNLMQLVGVEVLGLLIREIIINNPE